MEVARAAKATADDKEARLKDELAAAAKAFAAESTESEHSASMV